MMPIFFTRRSSLDRRQIFSQKAFILKCPVICPYPLPNSLLDNCILDRICYNNLIIRYLILAEAIFKFRKMFDIPPSILLAIPDNFCVLLHIQMAFAMLEAIPQKVSYPFHRLHPAHPRP